MKLPLLVLLAALLISACADEEPPQRIRHPVARYPDEGREPAASTQQPFNPNAPPPENTAREEPSTPPPPPPAPSGKVAKGDFPYGIPVAGKPHLVESPFSPGKYIDVEGFAPGTEVKDPYTGKIFLVP